LLAEDDDSVRALTCALLRDLGYAVLEARDGAEALALAQQHSAPIHMLLTDVVMPRLSGRQLAGVLATRFPALKVLYLSGCTDDAVIRHSIQDDETAFLPKPFTPAVLAKKVREILDR
jgi:two-component system, cell cycle sensor histidine kinase and response regulator CckA